MRRGGLLGAEVDACGVPPVVFSQYYVVRASPQPKVSKTKLVAWVAGADPDCCIFSAFAADLALNSRSPDDEDGTSWLYQDLQVPSPNKKLGGYAKDLVKPGDAKAYEKYALAQLPPGISAAGFRVCVCNTLTSRMPTEFAVQVTGHDLKGRQRVL